MKIKFFLLRFAIILGLGAGVVSCNLEQEIEVKLPRLPIEMVVECYLENGKPIKMTLTETSGYFTGSQPTLVDDARVSITKNNEAPIRLTFKLEVDEKNRKIYTHFSNTIVDGKPGDVYKLEITDPRGRRLTGTTTVQPKIPIDSVGWKFNDKPVENQEAYILIQWLDDPERENFYRLLVHRTDTNGVASVLDREFTDQVGNGKKITYFSTYRFKRDDTLTVKLYNVEESYFRFVSSTEDARRSNGNPFAQPVVINNTVAGGYGVFSHLNFAERHVIIK